MLTRARTLSLSALAALTSLAVADNVAAQSFANVPALTARGISLGVAVDSVGVRSGPMAADTRALVLQIPSGSTIVSASLFSFVRYRPDLAAVPPPPGFVRLNGQPALNNGAPPSAVVPTGAPPRCVLNGSHRVCFFTIQSDVTAIVESARMVTAGDTLALPVQETGDSGLNGLTLGEAFSYQGHAVVALYRNSRVMARDRFIGVWAGTADETAVPLGTTVRVPPLAVCPAGSVPERDERVVVSTTVLSEENVCGESNEIEFTFAARPSLTVSGVGGADDGEHTPIDLLSCALTGRAFDYRALISTGTFGGGIGMGTSASAVLTGRAVGTDGDDLGNGANRPRANDELFSLEAVPSTIRLWQGRDPEGSTLKSLGLVVMQFPADGDSDGDGHSDISEGICTRIDTDRDSNLREDWDDPDSDNDCVQDSAETSASRTIVASASVADDACRALAPATPFCDRTNGQCTSCMISCIGNPRGSVCRRGSSTPFECGCTTDSDCPAGVRCAMPAGVCQSDPNTDGGTSTDAANDASAVNDASSATDGAAFDGSTVDDAAAMDGNAVVNDGGAANDAGGAQDAAIRRPIPTYNGGACACRVGAVTAPRGPLAPLAAGLALSLFAARRGRRRARALSGR
jgi:hypothetical protein